VKRVKSEEENLILAQRLVESERLSSEREKVAAERALKAFKRMSARLMVRSFMQMRRKARQQGGEREKKISVMRKSVSGWRARETGKGLMGWFYFYINALETEALRRKAAGLWGKTMLRRSLATWRLMREKAIAGPQPLIMGAAMFMSMIQGIFDVADMSGDGAIDIDELPLLLRQLQGAMGMRVLTGEKLNTAVQETLGSVDVDRTGSISYEEFAGMLREEPYRSLLPPGVLAILPHVH